MKAFQIQFDQPEFIIGQPVHWEVIHTFVTHQGPENFDENILFIDE